MQSDSTNQIQSFDSVSHFKSLDLGKKLILNQYFEPEYGYGWKIIVENLIKNLTPFKFQLDSIDDSFGILNVQFTLLTQSHEIAILREIHKSLTDSRSTCATCGDLLSKYHASIGRLPKCNNCFKKGVGGTGTWLDKY
ncbi:MAG: hypothetical protein Q8R74_14120 [Methylophilus sp.]|nr:hypothetical protein [Methylophilus sp.]